MTGEVVREAMEGRPPQVSIRGGNVLLTVNVTILAACITIAVFVMRKIDTVDTTAAKVSGLVEDVEEVKYRLVRIETKVESIPTNATRYRQ